MYNTFEWTQQEEDDDKLFEDTRSTCGNTKMGLAYAGVIIVAFGSLIYALYKVNKVEYIKWSTWFKLFSIFMLHIALSGGLVALIINTLMPIDKQYNIFNPDRKNKSKFNSLLSSYGYLYLMLIIMILASGRERGGPGLTKKPSSELRLVGDNPLRTTQFYSDAVQRGIVRNGGKPRKGKKSSAKKSKGKAKGKKK
jgi:hypothetical protein